VRSAMLARTVRATGLTSSDALALIPHGEETPLRRLEPSGDSGTSILRDALRAPQDEDLRPDSQET
jgi:hypothetical protein